MVDLYMMVVRSSIETLCHLHSQLVVFNFSSRVTKTLGYKN